MKRAPVEAPEVGSADESHGTQGGGVCGAMRPRGPLGSGLQESSRSLGAAHTWCSSMIFSSFQVQL